LQKIALITDSACDLDRADIERHRIRVIPLTLIFSDGEYRDGIDITHEEVYQRMSQDLPKTSLPAPGLIRETIDALIKDGFTHILAIHLSSGLSGTFELVYSIAAEYSNVRIEVIDSKILSMGLGFIVRQAARWIECGLEFDTIVRKVRDMQPTVKGFFTLKTLEYLKKGGRIGAVQAAIGEILDLKPIIAVNEHGKYISHAKTRGRKQALDKVYDIALDFLSRGKASIAVLQGDARGEAMVLMERIRNAPNLMELILRPISPALVVHTGPGLIGLVVCPHIAD
jgi:DegV family protein with EDD domain